MTFVLVVMLSVSGAAAKGKPPPKTTEEKAPVSTSSNDPTAKAKELFGWAQKLYAQARYSEAIAKFEEAYQLKPHPVIFFNIGKCWEQLGETAKALRAYRDYLRLSPDASDKETVSDAIANLERRLKEKGVQQLMVFADPPTSKIEVDGKALGTSPASVELTAGNHQLTVSADGYEKVERAFVMSTQRATEMTITLRPVPKEPAPQPKEAALTPADKPAADPIPVVVVPAKQEPRRRVFTWVAAALAVVGAGGGTAFALLEKNASDTFHDMTIRDRMTNDALVSRMNSMALATNISFGVAGAAAVVAVLLFFLEGR